MSTYQGHMDASGRRFGIVVSRFNEFITGRLLSAVEGELKRHGAASDDIDIIWVPGAFEVPLACRKLAETGRVEAVMALACVIRGETPHFDQVVGELARGVQHVALECDIPILYGAVTVDRLDQAIDRAGGKMGNRGTDTALGAIEMVNLFRSLGGMYPEVRQRIRVLNGYA